MQGSFLLSLRLHVPLASHARCAYVGLEGPGYRFRAPPLDPRSFGCGDERDVKGFRDLLIACSAMALSCSNDRPAGNPGADTGVERGSDDLQVVDDYLVKWDRFAQGENQLVPELRNGKAAFEAALTRLLVARDKRAPARMVFYPVVQVGGWISADSELGKASAGVLGPDFPIKTHEKAGRIYWGGYLYLWWEANRGKYEAFPLFDEWSRREFAQSVAIPMFRGIAKNK